MSLSFPSNPFATRFTRPDAFPFFWDDATQSVELIDELLRRGVGLIVGPHGSGKSTLLHSLMPSLQQTFGQTVVVRFHEPESGGLLSRWRHQRVALATAREAVHNLGCGGVLMLDGAEQLRRRDLLRIVASAILRQQFVLATSHSNRCGLPVLYRTEVTPALIAALAHELLLNIDGEVVHLVQAELGRRDLTTLSNVRDLWFEVYDVVQAHLLSQANPTTLRNAPDGRSFVRGHDPFAAANRQC